MSDQLQWIVATKENPSAAVVPFESIFALKEQVTSLVLLFNTNSYVVNVEQKFFIINGGRKTIFDGMQALVNANLLYARRNRLRVSLSGQQTGHDVLYIVGIEGDTEQGEHKEFLLEVSSDGTQWKFNNHR